MVFEMAFISRCNMFIEDRQIDQKFQVPATLEEMVALRHYWKLINYLSSSPRTSSFLRAESETLHWGGVF